MVHNVRDCFRGVNCRLDRGLGAGCIVQSSDLQRLQDDGDDAEGDPQDGLRPEVMEEPTDVRQAHACATPIWDTCEVVARSWNGENGGILVLGNASNGRCSVQAARCVRRISVRRRGI